MEENFLFSLQTYTPNSDLTTVFKPNQVIYGSNYYFNFKGWRCTGENDNTEISHELPSLCQ